tara:strand:+ start:414 stop:950 length:537 start_codon:yes stop_codon:yes gene_type:complete
MKNPNLIIKYYQNEDANSKAVYSSCEKYRYSLTRIWNKKAEKLHFVMLNPSTATEIQNDPTVERCERRARTLNFGSFRVTNIFAWRDTDPKKMKRAKDPVGVQNNKAILDGCQWSDCTIAAWGNHGLHLDRGNYVIELLKKCGKPIFHLGISKVGQPKHPLYISYDILPIVWLDNNKI